MRWWRVVGACASVLLVMVFASPVSARSAKNSAQALKNTGYDISYPQCGKAYPTGQYFGIVGVNGGLANDANGCLGSELAWAEASPGLTSPSQAPASLYINTADPGPAPGVTDWPTAGSGAYGSCDGSWSQACAYIYGEYLAGNSYRLVSAINPTLASSAPWWLDIETTNTWATSSTPGYTGLNIAAIQGFIAGLSTAGAAPGVGIYSSASQWKAITGLTAETTASALGSSPPAWVAGARTFKQAHSNCAATGFTGAMPTLAQYSANGFDADLRCG